MFTTEYSIWFLPLCLVIALLYAAVLYYKADKPELSLWIKRIAFLARTLTIFILLFLLLNPLIKTIRKEKEKPILVLGIDNSESLRLCKDSAFYATEFQEQMNESVKRLKKDYRVDTYIIGDSIKTGMEMDFKDKETNLSAFFEFIKAKYINRNVGAVILISDGIFNAGQNPLYVAGELKYPIYTLALGDTNKRKDVFIAKINHNKTVYKNNFFPIEVLVKANKLLNQKAVLQVKKDDNVVFEKQISITNNEYSEWIRMSFQAKESGLHRYHVLISPVEDELTTMNNTSDVFVEVIDKREKIAIIYHAPHPDVSAIIQSLKISDMYEIESFPVDKFNKPVNEYDILILHQLPSKSNPAKTLTDDIRKIGIPVLYILGKQSHLALLNSMNIGLQISITREMYNDAYALYNSNFSIFSVSATLQQILGDLPPIQVPFGAYYPANSSHILMYQKIGNVATTYPLMLFNQQLDHKTAVFIGEGLWRWRNYNYLYAGNHESFDEMVSKTMQYLSVKEDKSFFRIGSKNVFNENDNILFDAEFYNRNYELINDPEVNLVISDKKKQYTYVFSRMVKSYHLDAGRLPVGDYHWKATLTHGGEKYQKTGYFSVKEIQIETINLVANHQLLSNLSSNSQAEMFYPTQWNELEKTIKNNDEIKTIVHYNPKHTSLLNIFILSLGIFFLLGTEWILRKWSGTY